MRSGRRSSLDERSDALLGYLFTVPSLTILVLLLFVPMGYSLVLSLYRTTMANSIYTFAGLQAFGDVFKNEFTWRIIMNSIIWTLVVVVGQLLVGLAGAALLSEPFPGRWIVRSIVMLPWVVPGVIAALVWRLIYDVQLGLVNGFFFRVGLTSLARVDWLGDPRFALWAVILTAIWKGFPFSLLMCLAALQGVPRELYEAADIDGASGWQRFFSVTIPGISEVLQTTALLISIWTFNYFEIIWVMTRGGPVRSTHIFPTYIYEVSFRNFDYGDASRYAVLSFVIVSLFSVMYIRRLRRTRQI